MSLDEYMAGFKRGVQETVDGHADPMGDALRALPESGEEALKPGDEVEARYVKATDGTMVASFGEFIVCNRSVRADELPAILVEVAAHIPAAELRAVLARVRVP